MQACSRALSSLWSAGRIAARSFSAEAAAGGRAAMEQSRKAAEEEGAKTKLFRILTAAQEPLTSEQIWEQAAEAGLKSKRFTKQMLQQLRQAGWVKTQPLHKAAGKKHKVHGYRLNQLQQQKREARLERQSAVGAGQQHSAAL